MRIRRIPTLIAEFGRFIDHKFAMRVQEFCNLLSFSRAIIEQVIWPDDRPVRETGTLG